MRRFPVLPATARIFTTALVLSTALACSDSSTGPKGPSVKGTWSGDFRGGNIRMTLSQKGSEVSGTLESGGMSYAVTGEVDAGGTFIWATEVNLTNCTSFGSARGFLLEDEASQLEGVMSRARRTLPCGTGTRTLVEQGSTTLRKAF